MNRSARRRLERAGILSHPGSIWLRKQHESREAVVEAVAGWVALLGAKTTAWTQEFSGRQREGLPVHVRITIEVA